MIDLFLMTALIVLFAGFRQLITQTRPDLSGSRTSATPRASSSSP